MYKLCIEDDDGQQTLVSIIRDEITIGRQEGNTIRLTERNVSRQHARLIREGDDIFMEEISARYGVRKNNTKISERAPFREGDVFLIGDYRLTLQGEGVKAAPVPEQRSATPRPRNEGTAIMPAKPAKLVVISSNFAGQEFPLRNKEMIIGRGEECDIIIDHRSVSQKHSKIIRESNSTYQIVDLNSKNGVCIAGEKYTNVHLKRGDVVELGHVKFRFVEPGENYVFTPQPEYDEDEATELMQSPFTSQPADTPKKSNTGVAIGIGVLLLVLVVAGGAFATGIFDSSPTPDPAVTTAVKTTDPVKATDPVTTNKEAFEATKSENPKVLAGIKKAKNAYEEGDIKRAIATLEALNEYADPSALDKENIDKLLSKARMERAFEKDYVAARALVESKDHLEALRIMKRIPPISIFDTLLEEERSLALSEVMDEAKSAYASKDTDKARELASALIEIDDQHEEARALLERMNSRPLAVAKVNRPASRDNPGKTKTKPKPKPKPAAPAKLSKEEMAVMYEKAKNSAFGGSAGIAISNCKAILRSGGTRDCHRVMAIAYKQSGNIGAACKSLRKAIRSNPTNKPALQTFMDDMGCDI